MILIDLVLIVLLINHINLKRILRYYSMELMLQLQTIESNGNIGRVHISSDTKNTVELDYAHKINADN